MLSDPWLCSSDPWLCSSEPWPCSSDPWPCSSDPWPCSSEPWPCSSDPWLCSSNPASPSFFLEFSNLWWRGGRKGGGGKEESRILRLWDLKCVGRVKMLLIRWRSVNCFMHCSCLKCKYSCASLAVRFPYKVLMVQCSHKYALFG